MNSSYKKRDTQREKNRIFFAQAVLLVAVRITATCGF